MEEVSLPVIVGFTCDVAPLNEIKTEFLFSEPHSQDAVELSGMTFKLKMEEEVKSEVASEVSSPAVVDSTAVGPNLNENKKEFFYSESNSDGKQEGTSIQLVGSQIKWEVPDTKCCINSDNDDIYIKPEPLAIEELHIKYEIDTSPTDQTEEKYTEDQHFDCHLCNSKFTCKTKFQQHLNNRAKAKICTGEKSFKCNICDYECVQKDYLQQHMKHHTGKKPLKCTFCNYECVRRDLLQEHVRTHTGEKPHKCNVCDFRCVQKGNFSRHMKIHTGEKRFRCGVCGYRCLEKGTLLRHMRIHTGEKRFKCKICDFESAYNSNVQRHMKLHTAKNSFNCNYCYYKCGYKNWLQRHMNISHSKEKPIA